ncbi:AAA family ATPase [Streptosporangium sp. NPDC050855]|uniref:AAA family ATPase n=1 Tax=Streptosporangium sp. NPDC050855 TaxID=3366194 RepID=UPI00379FC5D9
MIVWLNGTFGAGKTTTARELVSIIPEARLFDPEQVGVMLRHVPDLPPVEDFQDWPPWRGLVVETARRLLAYVGGVLVVPQTVLVEKYWTEIRARLERSRIPVHHVVLHTDQATLTRRIEEDTIDPEARQWRLDHLPDYLDALPWLIREGKVVDTTQLTPSQVAHAVGLQVEGGGHRPAARTPGAAPVAPPARTGVRRAGGRVRRAPAERILPGPSAPGELP